MVVLGEELLCDVERGRRVVQVEKVVNRSWED